LRTAILRLPLPLLTYLIASYVVCTEWTRQCYRLLCARSVWLYYSCPRVAVAYFGDADNAGHENARYESRQEGLKIREMKMCEIVTMDSRDGVNAYNGHCKLIRRCYSYSDHKDVMGVIHRGRRVNCNVMIAAVTVPISTCS